MGNPPDSSVDVAVYLNNQIWQKLNEVICNQTYIEEEYLSLQNFELYQNYPNPFNPSTKIKFTVPSFALNVSSRAESRDEGSKVQLIVYDILGNEIATLVNEYKPAGTYEVEFSTGSFGNATHLSSGMYFYNLKVGSFSETKKMIYLK